MQADLPADLAVGRHTVTVRNTDGFQGTRQYAFVVQQSADVAKGWTRFTPADCKLGACQAYAVASDRRGGVWVATNNGLNHFDGKTWTLRRKGDDGLVAETIYDLSVEADGSAWFTCFRGIGHVTPGGKLTQWRSLDPLLPGKKSFPGKQINRVLRLGDATYVSVFQRPGLFVLSGGEWSPVKINLPGLSKVVILDLAADETGRIWMGSNVGLLTWVPTRGDAGWTRLHKGNSRLPDDYVLRVAPQGGGAWIGTATGQDGPIGGLCRVDGQTVITCSPTDTPLPERRVWSVFIDSRGRVWAATSRGVACVEVATGRGSRGGNRHTDRKLAWRVFTSVNSGLADDMVTDVAEDQAGNMWFTTANGVSRLDAANRP
jgi:ligand-binding sensor domain-containing protein